MARSKTFNSMKFGNIIPSNLHYAPFGNFETFYFSNSGQNAGNTLHFHHYYELMLVMQGKVDIAVEGNLYHVPIGSLIIIPPLLQHCTIVSNDTVTYERILLHLMPPFLEELLTSYHHSDQGCFSKVSVFNCCSSDTATYRLLLERLITESHDADSHDPFTYHIQKTIISELLLRLERDLTKPGMHTTGTTSVLVSKVIDYISDHYQEFGLSLTEIASLNFVSTGYLSKLFRKYTGTTVYQYIIQTRLSHAQTMLLEHKPVIDACYHSGFQDYTSFLKAFRNNYYCTPKQFQMMTNKIKT